MIPRAAFEAGDNPTGVAPPKNQTRFRWMDRAFGGVDVQDTSKGFLYQIWTATYDVLSGNVALSSEDGKTRLAMTLHGIDEIALSFDINCNWVLAWRLTNKKAFVSYYHDASLGRVTEYLGMCSSIMMSVDDVRGILIGVSDILVTYITLARRLVVRGQREKYRVAHDMGVLVPAEQELANFGMGANGRLQWVTTNQKLKALP